MGLCVFSMMMRKIKEEGKEVFLKKRKGGGVRMLVRERKELRIECV